VCRQLGIAQAQFFEQAGPKILDHDVGLRGELEHDVAAFGSFQIDGDRFFVARLYRPPQRRATDFRVQLAPLA